MAELEFGDIPGKIQELQLRLKEREAIIKLCTEQVEWLQAKNKRLEHELDIAREEQ